MMHVENGAKRMNNRKRFLLFGGGGLLLLACLALSLALMLATTSASFASLATAHITVREVLAPPEADARTDAAQDVNKTYKKPRWNPGKPLGKPSRLRI